MSPRPRQQVTETRDSVTCYAVLRDTVTSRQVDLDQGIFPAKTWQQSLTMGWQIAIIFGLTELANILKMATVSRLAYF